MAFGKSQKFKRCLFSGLALPVVVFGAFAFSADDAFAYDDRETHPALTDEAVDFYNAVSPNEKISPEEREWIIEGSSLEDTPPRWVNHFYDPVHKTGWTGEKAGNMPAEMVRGFAGAALSSEKPLSAVEWAENYAVQESYSPYGGNRSWKRGIEYFAAGDAREAYLTLGHILHLVEDMGVPDHARGDTHADAAASVTGDLGSPYEQYAAKWTRQTIKGLGVARGLEREGRAPPARISAAEYLVAVAEYSNKYFFSKDTINDPSFEYPKITKADNNFGYSNDENGDTFPIARANYEKRDGEFYIDYVLDKPEEKFVFDSYFSHLSRQIVLNGAGLIALFKRQAADAEVAKDFPSRLVVVDPAVSRRLVVPAFSLVGLVAKMDGASRAALASVSDAAGKFAAAVAAPFKKKSPVPAPGAELAEQLSSRQPAPSPAAPLEAAPIPSAPAPSDAAELRRTVASLAERVAGLRAEADSLHELPAQPSEAATTVDAEKDADAGANGQNAPQNDFDLPYGVSSGGGGSSPGGVRDVTPARTPNAPQEEAQAASQQTTSTGTTAASATPEHVTSTISGAVETATSTGISVATSTASSATSTAEAASSTDSAASSSPPLVLVSEVQVAGADAGDEFVELYNPGGAPADISSWSLQYLGGQATSVARIARKNFEASSTVPAKGYFLVARGLNSSGADGYRGTSTPDMAHRTFSLSGEESGGTIFLVSGRSDISGADDPRIADRLAYGAGAGLLGEGAAAPVPPAGQSIERKAARNSACASAQGDGEFIGNGCDTGANRDDFELRASPKPQNSQNLIEPRSAPPIISFIAAYDSAPRIVLSWEASVDAAGATSSVLYALNDISDASATLSLLRATGTLAKEYAIGEVGREYRFEFSAEDRDGLRSAATSTVRAPSFLDRAYFYRDLRPGNDNYVVDVSQSSTRPFWGSMASAGTEQSWKIIVAYLNRDAPRQAELTTNDSLALAESSVRLMYRTCGGGEGPAAHLLVPFTRYSCQGGGLLSGAFSADNLEDNRLYVKTASSASATAFSPSDYLTFAFYDFAGGGGGQQRFALAATDATKYYFSTSTPPQASPSAPSDIAFDFDALRSSVGVSWATSTDSDTLDSLITYEVNISTSSALDAAAWQGVGAARATSTGVRYGNRYHIGVRAKDDFGNASQETAADWSFPADYAPLPAQTEHGAMIGQNDGSGQKVLIEATTTVSRIALWLADDSGNYSGANSYLDIRADASGTIGSVVAASDIAGVGMYEGDKEVSYSFASPVTLSGGTPYWLVPRRAANTNASRVYGSAGDAYAEGVWSGNPARDAYFRMSR